MRGAVVRLLAFASIQSSRAASLFAHGVGGATTLAELRRAIERGWSTYGQGASAAEPSLFDWEAEFYRGHLPPASRVLLVGCGAGRDLIALAAFGHTVDGLDIAREALAACRSALEKRGIAARLYASPVEEARIEAEYDAVVFTWFGYGYIPGRDSRIGTLRTLRGILRPEGRILLTYQTRPAGVSRVPGGFARLVARLTGSAWSPERGDCFEVLRGPGPLALHYEHRFNPAEVAAEAQAAGLRVRWHEQATEGRIVLARD